MVLPFLFHVLQCSVHVMCQLFVLSMDSYEAATTDIVLKNQSYMDAWPVSLRQLVKFHLKARSALAALLLLQD